MADKGKNTNKPVDEAGIRLAPTPIRSGDMNVLPPVRQDFIIAPQLHIENENIDSTGEEYDSTKDFQPKKVDVSKKWKRAKRGNNIVIGAIMFVATVFVVLPYILGACNLTVNMPFKYLPVRYNAIHNFIEAFKTTADMGWAGDGLKDIWFKCVPDMIVIIGILFLAINLIKCVYGLFAAVKPLSYLTCASVYMLCILIVFIASLVGVDVLGVGKIDFINDFIKDCANNEMFSLVVISLGYFVVAFVCHVANSDKRGYLR